MEYLSIEGGHPLNGTVKPSGNKNAVLPMICATLLTNQEVVITNVPEISDVEKLSTYFKAIGFQNCSDSSCCRLQKAQVAMAR